MEPSVDSPAHIEAMNTRMLEWDKSDLSNTVNGILLLQHLAPELLEYKKYNTIYLI